MAPKGDPLTTMDTGASSYRAYVRKNLERVLELLAHMSFSDFSHRVDRDSLPKDEFGDLFCGLDMLMADLAETRRELDEQYRYSEMRGELWEIATRSYCSETVFAQTILDYISPQLNITRAGYFAVEGEMVTCRAQWTRAGMENPHGFQFPATLLNLLKGNSFIELHRSTLSGPLATTIEHMMATKNIGTLIGVPCGDRSAPFGVVTFSDTSEQRCWYEPYRSFLEEAARVIETKTTQIRASNALHESNQNLEKEVAARTAELEHTNRQLQNDIEKRTRAEAALSTSETLYRSLVETSPDAILVCNGSGRISMINTSATLVFGVQQREELIGTTVNELVDHDGRNRLEKCWHTLDQGQASIADELHFLRLDGERFVGDCRVCALGSRAGMTDGRLVIVRDITEKRRHEEELQRTSKLESLGTLAGGIAHDFNNFLTGIISNIGLARAELTDGTPCGQLLDDAEEAALRAGGLTKQLLTFAKGGSPVKKQASLVDLIEASARFSLSGSRLAFRTKLARDLYTVKVDTSQIEQVLNNLIINANQAMPDGGTLVISAHNHTVTPDSDLPLPAGRYVRMCVKDTGMGIPTENLRRIFDPYFTTKSDGTGLGLTTAYSIIKRHHGHISSSSAVGVGSEFCFYLPASADSVPIHEPTRPTALVRGEGRVLVMDDDQAVQMVLERILTRAGYEVTIVEDGDTAIDTYREVARQGHPFDLTIMDLTIQGGKGGKEAAREVLDFDPEAKIIVVSGYSSDPILANYQSYGFAAMIAKPFQSSELTRTVGAVLGAEPPHSKPNR